MGGEDKGEEMGEEGAGGEDGFRLKVAVRIAVSASLDLLMGESEPESTASGVTTDTGNTFGIEL